MTIPVLILGDAPNCPTGLGRIARDIAGLLHHESQLNPKSFPVRVGQLGLNWDGSPWPWPVYPLFDSENWGRADIGKVWDWHSGGKRGVLFSVWDPCRCFGSASVRLNAERWGYFAIDAHDRFYAFGGYGADAVRTYYDRVLAYGPYGAGVLARVVDKPVDWLPHGIRNMNDYKKGWIHDGTIIGCVAANQPRKDLGLLFETISILRNADPEISLWLHTDKQITEAWSIPQLAITHEMTDDSLLVTELLSDQEMAGLYRQCSITIAPGLGEGWGYPIAESLGAGVPVVHGSYAGGEDLIPHTDWKFEPITLRTAGPHALLRPVFSAADVAQVCRRALRWREEEPDVVREYCKGSVANFAWPTLWPRWRTWWSDGLQALSL